jgi:hypothetical protein
MSAAKLEKLLSVKQARELYLGSYSKAEIYRMLECGQLRGLWERRGSRRHWSIPLSAIADFLESLHSNRELLGRVPVPSQRSTFIPGAAPFLSPREQRDRSRGAVSGIALVHTSSASRIHDLGAAPREIKEEL